VAAGLRGGVHLGDSRDRWRAHLHAGVDSYLLGDTRTAFTLGFDQRLELTKRVGLELAITGKHDFGKTWLDTGLFLRTYLLGRAVKACSSATKTGARSPLTPRSTPPRGGRRSGAWSSS